VRLASAISCSKSGVRIKRPSAPTASAGRILASESSLDAVVIVDASICRAKIAVRMLSMLRNKVNYRLYRLFGLPA
jgi:hypothetical protein